MKYYKFILLIYLVAGCKSNEIQMLKEESYQINDDTYLIESPYFKEHQGKTILELVPSSMGARKSRIPTSYEDWADNKVKYKEVVFFLKRGAIVTSLAKTSYNDWKSGRSVDCIIFRSEHGLVFVDSARAKKIVVKTEQGRP